MGSIESELNSENKILLQEIEKIVNKSIKNNTSKIRDTIISFLAKKAVLIFITIITACFATFGALTYFISTTNENIKLNGENVQLKKENVELTKQVEKLQVDIKRLKNITIKK